MTTMHAEPIQFVHLPAPVLRAARQDAKASTPIYSALARAHVAARLRIAVERGVLTPRDIANAARPGIAGADGRFMHLGEKLRRKLRRSLARPFLPPTLAPPFDPVFERPAARESIGHWAALLVRQEALAPDAAKQALARGGRALAEQLVSACSDYCAAAFARMPVAARGGAAPATSRPVWTVSPSCLYSGLMDDAPNAVVLEPAPEADHCGFTCNALSLTLDSPDTTVIAKAIGALASTTTVLHITPPHWILDDGVFNDMMAMDIASYANEAIRPDGTLVVPDALLTQMEQEYGWERDEPGVTERLLAMLRFTRERHPRFDGRWSLPEAARKVRQHAKNTHPSRDKAAALFGLADLLDWARSTRPSASSATIPGLQVDPLDEDQGITGLHVVAARLTGLEEGLMADMEDTLMQSGSTSATVVTADDLGNLFHLCVRDACVITALSNLLIAYEEAKP